MGFCKKCSEPMIEPERIKSLNDNSINSNDFVIYWMQQSQRTTFNHALEYAVKKANELKKSLLVYFGLTADFPDANLRHYTFMLQGLSIVKQNLEKRNIQFIIENKQPAKGIIDLAKNACLVVVDRGYLRIQKDWRKTVAENIDCPLIQIESDVVVPVETASEKEEYAAYTIRSKIKKHLSTFLTELPEHKLKNASLNFDFKSIDPSDISQLVSMLSLDSEVKAVDSFIGGEDEAKKKLSYFLNNHLDEYCEKRNDPSHNVTSQLSPYLHFGQISPVFIALEVRKQKSASADDFLEELIIRRELSMNFVFYNDSYDSINCLPHWAFETLKDHGSDKREYEYSLKDFEKAATHDVYWNAAQKEMRITGKMHGYMRMYWGKKILEWTESYEDAFDIALTLNNKYELDGRDANGFAGVAWCFGKHDRAWKERPVLGKIRYMSKQGLERKMDINGYVSRVERLHWNMK